MMTIALEEETLAAATFAAPQDHAQLTQQRPSGLASAAIVYCLLEAAAAWGWMHWRADLPALAPPLIITTLMRSAVLLVFVSAISQAASRSSTNVRARDAACVGRAALLLHAPWTLIVIRWPNLTWLWLACMCAAAVATTAKLGRDRLDAALIAAPYTGWLVAALYVETVTRGPFG